MTLIPRSILFMTLSLCDDRSGMYFGVTVQYCTGPKIQQKLTKNKSYCYNKRTATQQHAQIRRTSPTYIHHAAWPYLYTHTHAHTHLQLEAEDQPGTRRRSQPQSQPSHTSIHQLRRLARPQRVQDKRGGRRAELAPTQPVSRSHLEPIRLCLRSQQDIIVMRVPGREVTQ